MPAVENDYSPVVRQGTIEKASGILGRRRARHSLPDAAHGEELVLIDASGGTLGASGQATAGERYWGTLRAWVLVDVSDHHLPFRFGFRDTDGLVSYQIDAVLRVTVTDAAAVVRRKASGVRTYVEAAVRSQVTGALSSAAQDDAGKDALARFNRRLGTHTETLRTLAGRQLPVADWLTAVISDLSIAFDAATTAHYDQLVAADREAEVNSRSILNRRKTSMHEIELRKLWSQYLGEQVSDPLTRAVAAAAADPSAANIKEVADNLDADDRWQRAQFIATLNRLIDNKLIVEVDEIANTRVIIDGLQRSLGDGEGRGRPDKMLTNGDHPTPAGDDRQDPTVADAEIVDFGDHDDSFGSDLDWGN